MSDRLQGQRVVITGASRGFGAALAIAFAAEGARLALTATDRDHLTPVVRALADSGHEAIALEMDLRKRDSIDRACATALDELGGIDVVIANAGLLEYRGPLLDCPPEIWDDVTSVTVDGTFSLLRALVPSMGDGGAIINVTSAAAGRADWAAYGVSRLALNGITQILREELAGRNIRVVAVNPGPVRTEMRAAAYPDEDPATVAEPSERVEPFLAIAAGADPGWFVEASEWTG